MLRYKKYQDTRTSSKHKNEWYARSVHQLVEFDEFVKHMSNHHCVFSEATIRGVLIEAETCLRELLLDGKAVRLDDLGIFRIGLKTKPAVDLKDFTADNITGVRVNLYLGKRFKAAELYSDAQFKEADRYAIDDMVDGEDAVQP